MVEIRCPHCNYTKSIPPESIPPGIRWIRCPRCRNKFEYLKKGEDEKSKDRQPTLWERRLQVGLWGGIKGTIKSVNFTPKGMFSTMAVTGGWREPLAFGLLVGSIGTMVAFFWEFMIATSGVLEPLWTPAISLGSPIMFLSLIFLSPLLMAINLFISSSLIHVLLLMVRGGKSGFEATFRVVAYSQATRVWSVIPFVGGPIGWVWRTIVQIIGLKQAHEVSYARIVVALLIPLALLLVMVTTAFFLIVWP
jgi:hypothetical protein